MRDLEVVSSAFFGGEPSTRTVVVVVVVGLAAAAAAGGGGVGTGGVGAGVGVGSSGGEADQGVIAALCSAFGVVHCILSLSIFLFGSSGSGGGGVGGNSSNFAALSCVFL